MTTHDADARKVCDASPGSATLAPPLVQLGRKRPADGTGTKAPSGGPAPILALGFRPFFLMAAFVAAAGIPLWLLVFTGRMALPARLYPNAWHAHEMVFGFGGAVLAGFLLTAVRNWTSRDTPSGAPLAALAVTWLLGRVAVLFDGAIPHVAVVAIDVAFLPAVAVTIAWPIVRSRSWRNLGFVPLLGLLGTSNALFHLGSASSSARALRLAVDVFLLVMVLMGGRVIPMFTANALKVTIQRRPWLDWSSLGSMALVAGIALWSGGGRSEALACIVAGLLNFARLSTWRSLSTRKQPLLWILHVGYAWLAIGLGLRGLAHFLPTWSPTAPLHALTAGAMGTLILGMMARVGLGHTGRMLVASTAMTVSFWSATAGNVVRVFGPLVSPASTMTAIVVSGVMWTVAFGIFFVVYLPILSAPRVDGKPG